MLPKYGPKPKNHPSIGTPCSACKQPFKEGDYTTLIALGPGNNPESRELAKQGRTYNAVAVEIHYDCADPNLHT